MAWGMMFGVVVPEVGASRGPVDIKVDLVGAIPVPVEAHVDCRQTFLLDFIICKTK